MDTYKAVEENIPQAFKFLLRQAIQKPFGILLTSLTTLFFLLYLLNLRKKYLNRVATGLRIIKEDEGYNKIFDYNIDIPFWAFPLPQRTNNGVSKNDLITLAGLRNNQRTHVTIIEVMLLTFLVIQLRLYYISLVTNSYSYNWILIIQAIALLFSLSLILIWLLPSSYRNSFNNEQIQDPTSRRNFITTSCLLATGLLLGFFSKALSNGITKRLLKPRFHPKKKIKKITDCRLIELRAIEAIKGDKLQAASDIIYSEISNEKKLYFLKHYTRLFDLLILLCFKDGKIYNDKFKKTINLAKKSNNANLLAKSKSWEMTSIAEIKQRAKRKYWDKIEI